MGQHSQTRCPPSSSYAENPLERVKDEEANRRTRLILAGQTRSAAPIGVCIPDITVHGLRSVKEV
jgi:hypothetical protein